MGQVLKYKKLIFKDQTRSADRLKPIHVHHATEELIVVLSGRPTLRTADACRELDTGEVVACPVWLCR